MPQHGHFIWADLSSYRPETTKPFYSTTMGWAFQQGTDGYATATCEDQPVAGLYQMPQNFIDMGMPSFWMSYIHVDDVAATVEKARALGARVELGPGDFSNGGQFALIRDPLGAGFTVYQGPNMTLPSTRPDNQPGNQSGNRPGQRKSHALFVADATAVMPFYTALFGWQFRPLTADSWAIEGSAAAAHLYQVPDPKQRGKEQYWAVIFHGDAGMPARAIKAGGEVVTEIDLHDGATQVIADPDGGRFFVQLAAGAAPQTRRGQSPLHWKGWAGLALIALSALTGWGAISALFFAIWTLLGLRDRETYLLEPISRANTPLLYWCTIATFSALIPITLLFG